MTGIYKITNKINGKCYIGQSINIKQRWKAHRSRYQVDDYPLYRAMRKYGLENFNFEVIEECTKELLNEREIYWISYYDATNKNKGYNLGQGGQNTVVHELTKEQLFKIYELLRQGITQTEIAKQFNIAQSLVSTINTGTYYYQEGIDYPIVNTKKKKITYCVDCGKEVKYRTQRCMDCAKKKARQDAINRKPISREELKFLIRSKPFTYIGKMYNVSANSIRKWCKIYELPSTKKEINSYSDEEWEKI